MSLNEPKVSTHYDDIKYKDLNLEFSETSPEEMLNILKGLNPPKAAGIVNLSRKFRTDGADILAKPISLSNSIRFLEAAKLQKSKRFLKKAPKLTLKTTAPFHYSPYYQKLLKGLFMTKQKSFGVKAKFSTDLNTCLGHLTDKITTGFEVFLQE